MQRSCFYTHYRLALALTALAGLVVWLGYSWSGPVKALGAKAGDIAQSVRNAPQPGKALDQSSIADRAFGAMPGGRANTVTATPLTTIMVTTTANTIAADGQCSLREAIINANNDAATHADCAAGSGADTIALAAGATYTLSTRDNTEYGFNGLPAITSQITIEGNGATITRGGSVTFRLFYIASSGNLTLQNLILSNGLAKGGDGGSALSGGGGGGAGLGGAVFNQGALALVNSTISGSKAQGGNGGKGDGDYGDATGGGGGGGIGGNGGANTGSNGGGGGGGFGGNGGSATNSCAPTVYGFGGGGGGGTVGNGISSCNTVGGGGGTANGGAGGNFGFPGVAGGYGGGGGGAGGAQSTGSNPTGGAGGIGGGGGGGGNDGTISTPHGDGGAGGFGGAGGGGGQSSSQGGNGGTGGFAGGGGGGGQGGTTSSTHFPGVGGQSGFGAGNGGIADRNYGSGGGGGGGLGGAIFNDQGGVITLNGCALSGNTAQGGRGGDGSNGNINNLTIFPGSRGGNGGSGYGGAIFNRNGSITLTDCTLSGNLVTAGSGGVGRIGNGAVGDQNGCAIYNLRQSGGTATVTLINTTPNTGTGCDAVYNNGGTINTPPPCQTITLNPSSLPAGHVNVAYNQTITASGGAAPHSFAVTVGNLPSGLSLAPTGALSGTPNAGGAFSFTVTATDANGCTGALGYNLTVNANSAPDAVDDAATTTEDSTVNIAVLANDTDVNGDTLTVTGVTQPANGMATLNANGTVTYTPNANFNGADSFGYTISDGKGGGDSASVNITVNAVNDAPTAAGQSVTTNEDIVKSITLAGGDVDGDSLSFTVVSQPAHGTLGGGAPNLTYTPHANYNGPDSFTFKVGDGAAESNVATVSITVVPVNDAPTAGAQSLTTNEDGSQAITLAGADVDGDTLSFSITGPPANGALSGVGPNLTYTPNADFSGADSFTYSVSDGNGGTATATISLTISPVNDAPSFVKGPDQTVGEDGGPQIINLWATAVSAGPANESGQSLSFQIAGATNPGLFSAGPALNAAGDLTYTLAANANGGATITVVLKDSGGTANGGVDTAAPQSFVITVTAVNDAPAAANDAATTPEDNAVTVGVLGNDTDVDGDTLSVTAVTQGANGSVAIVGGGVKYTPNANFNGSDSFTYTINDGNGGAATATVSVTITAANDPPDAANDAATVAEGSGANAINVLANDRSAPDERETLTVTVVAQGANGAVAITGGGAGVSYTPNANFSGTDSFTYTIGDGNGGIDTATVTVTVTAVNRAPVAICQNVTVTAGADCAAAANINNGSYDPDGDTLTFTQTSAGPYAVGTRTVTLTVNDGRGGVSSCAASVTVNVAAPIVAITGPPSGVIYPVNMPVNFTGAFSDASGTTHTANWQFASATGAVSQAGVVDETARTVNATQSFTSAGVYLATLTVVNNCGGQGSATTIGVDQFTAMVVVYDPEGGFVTGGGWINSPAGAYVPNPSLTGKANFGFVSKYQKGATAPTGNTEFQFKAGNLNFHSSSYEWLVVAGARAQYKGAGKINGAGDYRFILTAIDGQQPGGGGVDKFRIRIWNNNGGGLVYDNQLNAPDNDDPTTVLGGGSIVIHK
ncbi:MAG: Ig-like domain-containing protein [Blastocatellales bacterium]